jgi:pimeloyl-ACP methyl ester carboxylesterase/uncharacterized protein YndB with AHSA1/START domain
MSTQKITVETTIAAPISEVWRAYTTPEDIMQWNAASDDWHTTNATVDLREGGAFYSRMEAKDGSFGFDFAGVYTKIIPFRLIEYSFGERAARVELSELQNGVAVRVEFDSEPTYSIEQQLDGWQAILNRFARYAEARVARPLVQAGGGPMLKSSSLHKKGLRARSTLASLIFLITLGAAAYSAEPVGKYADVNGLHMYYEVHGKGAPVLLIHGGLCTVNVCFGQLIENLAATRQVIAYEYQGHGHTADIDRPLRPDLLADDASKFLTFLKIQKADVLGFSDGAIVAFDLARTHPEQVNALITMALYTRREGAYPELFAGMKTLNASELKRTPIYDAYRKVAPKPEQFDQLCKKVSAFTDAVQDVPIDEVKTLKMPTMFILGDADMVKPEHAVELFRATGGGVFGDVVTPPPTRLAILPGTTHYGLISRSKWIAEMVEEFLQSTAKKPIKE